MLGGAEKRKKICVVRGKFDSARKHGGQNRHYIIQHTVKEHAACTVVDISHSCGDLFLIFGILSDSLVTNSAYDSCA